MLAVLSWVARQWQTGRALPRLGSHCERFNPNLREELLNGDIFYCLKEARPRSYRRLYSLTEKGEAAKLRRLGPRPFAGFNR